MFVLYSRGGVWYNQLIIMNPLQAVPEAGKPCPSEEAMNVGQTGE